MSKPEAEIVRSVGRRIAVNSAAQFGSYALNTILGAGVGILLVRHLGQSKYGELAFVVAYVSLFQIVTHLGVDTVIVREIARSPNRAEDLLGAALGLRLVLSAGAMLLAWVLVPVVVAHGSHLVLLVVVYSTVLLSSWSTLYAVLFNVELRSHIPNTVLGAWSVAYSLVRLCLIALGAEVIHFLVADVFSAVVVVVLSHWVARRHSSFRARLRMDVSLWRGFLAEGYPIAIATWLMAVHLRIDQLILFQWTDARAVGNYAAAVRVSEVWGAISNAFMVSLFPLLSRYATEDHRRMERTVLLAYRYSYLLICPVALALIVYGEGVLRVLFGVRFIEGATALAVLAVAEVFAFSNAVTYNVLLSTNRQQEAAYVAGGSLIVNVALNFWLIPIEGITGAATASLGSYAAIPILTLLVPRIRRVGFNALRELYRPAVATGITACALWLVSPRPLVGIFLIMAAYPMAAMMAGCVGVEELKAFAREVAGRRRA